MQYTKEVKRNLLTTLPCSLSPTSISKVQKCFIFFSFSHISILYSHTYTHQMFSILSLIPFLPAFHCGLFFWGGGGGGRNKTRAFSDSKIPVGISRSKLEDNKLTISRIWYDISKRKKKKISSKITRLDHPFSLDLSVTHK